MDRTATAIVASVLTALVLGLLHSTSSRAAKPAHAACVSIVGKMEPGSMEQAQDFISHQLASGRTQVAIGPWAQAGTIVCTW